MSTPYNRPRTEWRDTHQIRLVTGTQVSLTNSTTATDVINEVIYANEIGENGMLRFSCGGTYLNNTGGTLTKRLSVKFGGSFVYNDALQIATSANTRAWYCEGFMVYANSTSTIRGGGYYSMSATNTPNFGVADLNTLATYATAWANGSASVSHTTNRNFEVEISNQSTGANNTLTCDYALLEVIRGF